MTAQLPPERNDDALLLPWHATGRLDPADRARLEAALADDPALQRDLGLAREEQAAVVSLNEALGAPSRGARDALFARIDAATTPPPASGWLARLAGLATTLSPRTLALAGTAAALVIVAEAGVVASLLSRPAETRFITASAPGEGTVTGQMLLVGFVPEASTGAVTAWLEAEGARIVRGPLPGGLYEVVVADHRLPEGELAPVVERWRHQGGIVRVVVGGGGAER